MNELNQVLKIVNVALLYVINIEYWEQKEEIKKQNKGTIEPA